MTNRTPDLDTMHGVMGKALGIHWRLLLAQGVTTVVLGVIAIVWPIAATIAAGLFFGWLLLFCGIMGLVGIIATKKVAAFPWNLATAVVSVTVGILLIWKPVEGALSLTFLLAVFFLVEGVFQIATSIAYRHAIRDKWGWMLASGVADLALVAIIALGWPMTASWTLGLLVGVNLITSGVAATMAARGGRRITRFAATSTEDKLH
jgi:uncharacterized membrane protein HdeD (DUF308 family)